MARITTHTARLSVLQKCEKGQSIITKSTDNPLVPGNGAALAAFSTAQTELVDANAALVAARETLAQLMAQRDGAEVRWDSELGLLASFTEAATDGVGGSMLSAGFGLRAPNTPSQPLPAPEAVAAKARGAPGNTKVHWDRIPDAASYLVEASADPIAPDGWRMVTVTTRASHVTGGNEPGQVCWYRVAAVNAAGQSPWSAPACREVM